MSCAILGEVIGRPGDRRVGDQARQGVSRTLSGRLHVAHGSTPDGYVVSCEESSAGLLARRVGDQARQGVKAPCRAAFTLRTEARRMATWYIVSSHRPADLGAGW